MTEKPPTNVGELRWLDGENLNDYGLWLEVWRSTRARRPHDHPGYLRAMGAPGNLPAAAIYRHPSGAAILYPFYRLSLTDLPFYKGGAKAAIHIVSPYGYGGPLYEGPRELQRRISADFEALFQEEATRRGVVSEFVREDLFRDRLAYREQGMPNEQQPNVVVRLDRDPDEIWRNYHSKVRKNVNKARHNGLRVVFDASGDHLDQFLAIYHETMERTGATGFFFLGKEVFELLGRALGADGGLSYAHVLDGDDIVSTELLLLSNDTIYSFLGGTSASAFEKRPNDLLKHEVITWGVRHGFKFYVLGGGIKPGDGTFIYKKAFDPEGVFPFVVRRVRHDPGLYRQLIEWRKRHETEQGRGWKPREDFFPEFLA